MMIRITGHDGAVRSADLFGTFAALVRDEIADFPALRAHQRHPWHAFTVQVATLALLRAGETELPGETEAWRDLLLALTPAYPGGEAWSLVVDDWDKPALLQPPGMDVALRRSARRVGTPDKLDMLVTGRNHDLKGSRIICAADDDWLFALVSLQTQEGWGGRDHYWISRMNSGYGARVGLGLRPDADTPGSAFRRDVARLLGLRPRIADESEARGELGLVWLERWDGVGQIRFADLDPYYVEICRRVRLIDGPDRSKWAVITTSKAPRIAAEMLKGVTGDPWAPVLADGTQSWGVSGTGFGYSRMTDLLDKQAVRLPPLAEAAASDGKSGLTLLALAVTRGKNKTEGYHERSIPVPPKAAGLFARGGHDRLADVAKVRRELADQIQKILRHALFVLHRGGIEEARDPRIQKTIEKRIERFERRLDQLIDARFFDDAFWQHATFEGPPEEGDATFLPAWRRVLADDARRVLDEAIKAAPRTQMRRLRAVTRANGIFHARVAAFLDPDSVHSRASSRRRTTA